MALLRVPWGNIFLVRDCEPTTRARSDGLPTMARFHAGYDDSMAFRRGQKCIVETEMSSTQVARTHRHCARVRPDASLMQRRAPPIIGLHAASGFGDAGSKKNRHTTTTARKTDAPTASEVGPA